MRERCQTSLENVGIAKVRLPSRFHELDVLSIPYDRERIEGPAAHFAVGIV
jgi:hypothetical protein